MALLPLSMSPLERAHLSQLLADAGHGRGGSADLAARSGHFRGEAVRPLNTVSNLWAAMEELTMFLGQKVEASKKLEQRKVAGGSRLEVLKIEEVSAYLRALRAHDDPQALVDLARRMLSGRDSARRLAGHFSRDVAQQYLALHYALDLGEREQADPQVLEGLRDTLGEMLLEHGPAIRAGLNTSRTAGLTGATRAEVEAFQQTYRDVVLGDSTLVGTLKLLLERIGDARGEDFKRGLGALISALGEDLASVRPSTEPARLQSLVSDLYHLEVMATVLDACHDLSRLLAARHGMAPLEPGALTGELVNLTNERWVGGPRIVHVAEKFGVHELVPQIHFLTGVKSMLRELPLQIYPDPDTRQTVLNAAEEALETTIAREED